MTSVRVGNLLYLQNYVPQKARLVCWSSSGRIRSTSQGDKALPVVAVALISSAIHDEYICLHMKIRTKYGFHGRVGGHPARGQCASKSFFCFSMRAIIVSLPSILTRCNFRPLVKYQKKRMRWWNKTAKF